MSARPDQHRSAQHDPDQNRAAQQRPDQNPALQQRPDQNHAAQQHVVVVGAGIAGLAAAFFLRGRGAAVTVLEGSPRLGGKLTVSEVAGIAVDAGAEALLARRPEGVELIRAVSLGGRLVEPGTTAASIWARGELRPLPRRHFMGVPADLDELAASAILSPAGLARARKDLQLPATPRRGDVSVASQVAVRFGQELVDQLVDPLLGGVYAGRSDELSFEATMPGLAAESLRHSSLAEAARALTPRQETPEPPPPVFTTLTGGLGTLPPALAAASGAVARTGAMVRELARTPGGWRLRVGSAHAPQRVDADAVILAVPARPAARLLGDVPGAAAAAAALAEIGYASMAVITLAYPAAALPPRGLGSGYLVPAVTGRAVKAVTFSTMKWPHLLAPAGARPDAESGSAEARDVDAGGVHVVRCSVGRIGEEAILQREDGELVALAAAELADATGARGRPVDWRVTRWGGGLPQYYVGHLDRVARIRAGVAAQPGLAVCGAAYDGVGIPACIASARAAADQILAYLESRRAVAADAP